MSGLMLLDGLKPAALAFLVASLSVILPGCDSTSASDNGSAAVVMKQKDRGPPPKLGQVPPFELTDQDGKPFGSQQLHGRPYLAAFMFTRCPSICPRLTAKMREVDEAVKAAGIELQLLSFSVDPENDTPETLRAYAKKHRADVDNWNFLTGDYKLIAKTAEAGFKLALSGSIDESKPHLGITHGSHLVLVDQDGNLRGYFRSSEAQIAQDIVSALQQL